MKLTRQRLIREIRLGRSLPKVATRYNVPERRVCKLCNQWGVEIDSIRTLPILTPERLLEMIVGHKTLDEIGKAHGLSRERIRQRKKEWNINVQNHCRYCGKEISSSYGKKYCSDECRSHASSKVKLVKIKCNNCGKVFEHYAGTESWRKYCSKKCYTAHTYKRRLKDGRFAKAGAISRGKNLSIKQIEKHIKNIHKGKYRGKPTKHTEMVLEGHKEAIRRKRLQ